MVDFAEQAQNTNLKILSYCLELDPYGRVAFLLQPICAYKYGHVGPKQTHQQFSGIKGELIQCYSQNMAFSSENENTIKRITYNFLKV